MNYDLGALVKAEPLRFYILDIQLARMNSMTLHLFVLINDISGLILPNHFAEIICTNVVDYSIRPKNPNCIQGGPAIEFHEQHSLLTPSLQAIPGGDGELFNPPLKLSVLILEQSYVIAERFEIRSYKPNIEILQRGPLGS